MNPFAASASCSEELWQRLEARRPAPLRFVLHLSRRPNASLCPCLQVELASSFATTWGDRTSFTVTRILDPEHRIPYITLSPLFYAGGLTLIQGLLRFSLAPASFDVSLAGLEPWDDMWVTLPLARNIAAQLGLHSVLAEILNPRTALAWSLDEFEAGLSHNWRVPHDVVDSAAYSTDAITAQEAKFAHVQMLPLGQQIKTLVSADLRSSILESASQRAKQSEFRLHQKLVRWTSQVWSAWADISPILQYQVGSSDAATTREVTERVSALIEELGGSSIPPTWVDLLEWTQLSAQAACLPPTTKGHTDEESLLSSLSLAQLAQLRTSTHGHLCDMGLCPPVLHQAQADQDTLLKLQPILRAKLASLHTINLLSLPFSSSSTLDPPREPYHPATSNPHYIETRSTRTPSVLLEKDASSAYAKEFAALHAKVDALTAKIEALTAVNRASASVAPQHATGRSTGYGKVAENSELVMSNLRAIEADTRASAVDAAPPPPLGGITASSPSLIVVIASLAFFFAIIQSIPE